MADTIEGLTAVLDLLEPLGIELYIQDKAGGSKIRWDGTKTFVALAACVYDELVFAVRDKIIWSTSLRGSTPVVAGDIVTIGNADELADLIYELIDRGVFLSDDKVR